MRRSRKVLGLLLLSSGLFACAPSVRRFPLAPPRWQDQDRNHVAERPSESYSGLIADGADKTVFRPLARLAYFPIGEPAWNVNALDEVPSSAWFQNRIGMFDLSPEEVAKAACGDEPPLDPTVPWTVVAAKPNGANPGFFIEAEGQRYLLKFDGAVQPEQATSADVIGSKIYWAVGYHTPCNQVVFFKRDILRMAPDAEAEGDYGEDRALTQADVEKVLDAAWRTKDGTLRASASKFLPGKPLGPFSYEGTRGDDPNDHIPHQHRRELRANRILASWLNHHDAREQNTLDVWVERDGRTYIRHHMIDFGDCFGSRWDFPSLSQRMGHSYFVDFEHLLIDYVTLGITPRVWHEAEISEDAEIFGYFAVEGFVASKWKTDYPNPAFSELRYDDALWMARILSRFSDEHVAAIVETAQLSSPRAERYLRETLIGRRHKILREYLSQYAPLDRFRLVRRKPPSLVQSLCFEDLAILHGVADPTVNVYKIRFYAGEDLEDEIGWLQFQPDPDHPTRSCVQLPLGDTRPAKLAPKNAPDDHPLRYGVMKIWIHQRPSVKPTSSIHLYFYDLGPAKGYRLVGIERPDQPVLPDVF